MTPAAAKVLLRPIVGALLIITAVSRGHSLLDILRTLDLLIDKVMDRLMHRWAAADARARLAHREQAAARVDRTSGPVQIHQHVVVTRDDLTHRPNVMDVIRAEQEAAARRRYRA